MEIMASEGGSGDVAGTAVAVASVDLNSLQAQKYPAQGSQGHTYQYYSSAVASTPALWPVPEAGNSNAGNGALQNVNYQYNPQQAGSVQDGSNASTSTAAVTDNASHAYTAYSYPTSTNQYGYGGSEYANYYSNYQQQPNQSYPQAPGAYQNSGSPYQPISSFQNTGSYAGPTSYSSTYYNPGDYQTTGAYTGSSYSSQANVWSQGNYPSYSQQYASYGQDTSSAYSSSNAAATTDYHQHYKQWADYYSSQTEVTCAPGTENTTVTATSTLSCPVPGVASGYATPVSQSQPTYAATWKPEPSTSVLPSVQTGNTVGAYDDYWKHATQTFQDQHVSSVQANFQKPLDVSTSYPSVQDQQQTPLPPVPGAQFTGAHQLQPTYQKPLQSPPPQTDYNRVSKLQIPANPRIASNLAFGHPKPTKDTSTSSVTAKPAYVSVSLPKPNDKVLSNNASDSNLKSGMFPPSLRGYVERALARCKDEKQRAACQEVMKEMITKATADGTLHSRDWDTEPLFPLPDTSDVNNEQSAAPVSSLPTFRKSPSRRTKSRWEPLPEEKPVEKPTSTYQDSAKLGGWAYYNGRDHKFTGGKSEGKDGFVSKFSAFEQSGASRSAHRPVKKQRFGDELNATENGDGSSDNDNERGLTAYYSGAIALANSPEERKRRESRSKRFEKGDGQRENHFRPKSGVGNLYSKRATALALSKTFEDGGARAVEDIDWDALTVKGTCKEIEKRYLRLTSAPDPSTVRPEEVLDKALHMVHTTPKNYLYKCDQLKSIRQDLTVQRIRNELTVKVYETHARLALEFGDLPEFNQCQSQLKSLYAEGITGCHMEFSAYNLLSVIIHSNNRRELLSSMSRLSDEAKRHEAVRHALSVRAAITTGNFVLFFKLYKTAPNLNTCIMDLYVEKMRFEAVKCMSRAYRPTIPVSYIAQVLGFSSSPEGEGAEERDVDGWEECTEWLKAHGACLIADSNGEMLLDAKASSSTLYMPEPEDAVAHGDANLAVNDFLTRTST